MMTTSPRSRIVIDVWGKSFALWIPTYQGIGAGFGPGVKVMPVRAPGPVGTDLVVDGGFEQGLGLWQAAPGADAGIRLESGTANVYRGVYAAAFDQTSAHAQQVLSNVPGGLVGLPSAGAYDGRQARPLTPGSILQVSGVGLWVSPNGTAQAGLVVDMFDQNGAFVAELIGPTWMTETTFTPKSARFVIPQNVFFGLVSAFCDGTTGGGTFYIDECHAAPVALPSDEVALTDAATIAVDATAGTRFTVRLGGNRTMGAPTGQYQNQRITFRIVQDATGGRTLAWNAAFKTAWSDAGNAAGKQSTVAFYWNGTNWIQDGAQSPYV